jgi:hypothetical protein
VFQSRSRGFQSRTLSERGVQVPKEMGRTRWSLGFKEDERGSEVWVSKN